MKTLTLARDLRRRKARDRHGLFVAEGIRTVEELLGSTLDITGALVSPALLESPRGVALAETLRERKIATEEVGAKDFESAAETDSPQGILAIAGVPNRSLTDIIVADPLRLLILDAVQDPGNVGTILRTSAALGATATFSLPGTVDLWNAKVVRSGMGAHFHHPCLSGTWDELDSFRRDHARASLGRRRCRKPGRIAGSTDATRPRGRERRKWTLVAFSDARRSTRRAADLAHG